MALWVDIFGLVSVGPFRSESENVDEEICALGDGPLAVEVDLMEPIDPERKPAVHTVPLNHVGLWVDDLRAAVAWMTTRGVRFAPGGIRQGAGGHEICFIHPKGNEEFPLSGEGVLIELVQAPPDVISVLGHATERSPEAQLSSAEESQSGSGAGFGDGTGFGGGSGTGAGFTDGSGFGGPVNSARGLMKLPMPGSTTYIVMPEAMDATEAKGILSWLKRVVSPAVRFACGAEEDDEAE